MPESETEKGYLHKKMSMEMKKEGLRRFELIDNSCILVKAVDLACCTTAS